MASVLSVQWSGTSTYIYTLPILQQFQRLRISAFSVYVAGITPLPVSINLTSPDLRPDALICFYGNTSSDALLSIARPAGVSGYYTESGPSHYTVSSFPRSIPFITLCVRDGSGNLITGYSAITTHVVLECY